MREEYFEIQGGRPLVGQINLHAAKNAVLPILAAATLTEDIVEIKDCPFISDIGSMLGILISLGFSVERQGRSVFVSGSPSINYVPEYLACSMRSSAYMLGALLTNCGEVKLYTPGGCRIGARPMDIHLDGLSRMGAEVEFGEEYVLCRAEKLKGAEIVMKYPSVGATENLLLAAVKAHGETILIGCAREPEIVSMAEMLNLMGARIYGAGTSVMRIVGVDSLGGVAYTPVSDRIIAGTVMSAVAVCGGDVSVTNCNTGYFGAAITPLLSSHVSVVDDGGGIRILSDGLIHPLDLRTGPYPLFPTDLQAPYVSVACFAKGVSMLTETVFENRFAHINELMKLGADIDLENETAIVHGGCKLSGAELYASDLRGGAALIVAALGATGNSKVYGLKYVERGYEEIDSLFSALGARIIRKSEFNP